MKIALHACCGPCLLEPYDILADDAEVVVIYANPNIHPIEEYERRRGALAEYAATSGIEVVEVPYEPAAWIAAVADVAADAEQRCRRCYRLRFAMVARVAAELGCDTIATTLTVSPYQDPDAIREEGERAAADAGLLYVHRDFRTRYADATRRSRELGMYRQNYCGCLLSEIEAREQRERRRAEKAARKGSG